jgi:intracellular multiplication protein IcmL
MGGENGPLETVMARNAFYRDGFRLMQRTNLVSVIVTAIALTSFALYIFFGHSTRYFATTEGGRVVAVQDLAAPNWTRDTVAEFANRTMVAIYTLRWDRYQEELQQRRDFFTADGWPALMTAFERAGTLDYLRNERLIASAVPLEAPLVVDEGLNPEGRYTWLVEVPLEVSYRKADSRSTQRLVATLTIVQVPVEENPRGLAVHNVIARPYKD